MRSVCTLAQAQAALEDAFDWEVSHEMLPLSAALGRVLFQDLYAVTDLPAYDRSVVDGYAILGSDSFGCSESLPVPLSLAGRVEMGAAAPFCVSPGECAYVPTGGALPRGADAVVMLEYAHEEAGLVMLYRPAAPGANVLCRGDDVKADALILKKGRVLTPGDIGVLAALGIVSIPAARRPRVAVLSTGSELIDPECVPAGAQIRDVNGPMLCALIQEAGGAADFLGIAADAPEEIMKALQRAKADAQLILLSGGTSVGEKDAAEKALSALGRLLFHGIAVKPGKPTLAGSLDGIPVIGLPGHPLAAYFMFRLLAEPLICRLAGRQEARLRVQAKLLSPVPSNHGREEYLPVLYASGTAQPMLARSGQVGVLALSNGFIRVPRDCEGLPMGTDVEVALWHTPLI